MPVDSLPQQEQMPAAPLLIGAYSFVLVAFFVYLALGGAADADRPAGDRAARARPEEAGTGLMPTAAHFFYIPGILLLGIVIGWILGSRAAADAYAAQMRRASAKSQVPNPKTQEPAPKG